MERAAATSSASDPAIIPEYWPAQPSTPKPALADEDGRGRAVDYDKLLAGWRDAGA